MSTAGVETVYAIKYGTLYSASEQHLVSCDPVNLGCGGGWPTDAFDFWLQDGGPIASEAYPYTDDESPCYSDEIDDSHRLFQMADPAYAYDGTLHAEDFKRVLREVPLTVAFGVGDDFMYYMSGVYDGVCETGVNHGMVAIGYGYDEDEQLEYALLRNSWGPNWGEDGYVRVILSERDDADGGKCMMITYANHPIVA